MEVVYGMLPTWTRLNTLTDPSTTIVRDQRRAYTHKGAARHNCCRRGGGAAYSRRYLSIVIVDRRGGGDGDQPHRR
jgi:hypothetical protein